MLTIEDVFDLGDRHGLMVTAHYDECSVKGRTPPKPTSLTISFQHECAEAWKKLMSELTEVPLSLHGTRQVTGNGATDGRLFPAYSQLLTEVNAARQGLGLSKVFG